MGRDVTQDEMVMLESKSKSAESQLRFYLSFSFNGREGCEGDGGEKTDVLLEADVFAQVLTCVSVTTGHEL